MYGNRPDKRAGWPWQNLRRGVPAAEAVEGKPGDFVDNAVRQNARNQAEFVRKSNIFGELAKAGKVKLVAARYGLDSGAVAFLD